MAEICSAHPTSGGPYFWSAKLSTPSQAPFAAWMTGWFNLIGYASTLILRMGPDSAPDRLPLPLVFVVVDLCGAMLTLEKAYRLPVLRFFPQQSQ